LPPIELNVWGAKVAENKYTISGGDGLYIDAPPLYRLSGGENAVSEKPALEGMAFLSVRQLCNFLGINAEGDFPLSKRQEISAAAQKSSNLIIPEIARDTALNADSIITLVPIAQDDSLTPLYQRKHLLVELGVAVAASDGKVEDYEIIQLSFAMETHFKFTEFEIRALSALKDYSVAYTPDIPTIARLLASELTPDERLTASEMMMTVAAAGGQIARKELNALRVIFETMGFGESTLNETAANLRLKRVWVLVKGD
jgi:uncharacterized tellurite resistance protein B-like protein